MADPIDPSTVGISAEALTSLKRERELIEDLSKAFREYGKDADESNKKIEAAITNTKIFFDQIRLGNAEAAKMAATQGNLNDKLNEFKKILAAEADAISSASGLIKENLNKAIQENIEIELKLHKIRYDRKELDKKIFEASLKEAQLMEKLSREEEEYVDAIKEKIKTKGALSEQDRRDAGLEADAIKRIVEVAKARLDTDKALADVDEEALIAQHHHNSLLKERLPLELSLLDVQKLQTDHTIKLNEGMDGLIDRFGVTSNKANIFTSATIAATKGVGNLGKSIGAGLMQDLLSPEKALNRFFNFINDFAIQSSFSLNKSLADINKQLGGMGEEFEAIATRKGSFYTETAVADLAKYGIGLKELGNAYSALSKSVINFNNLSEHQRNILARNAAKMENLNVSAQLNAELTAKLMGGLGKTADGVVTYMSKISAEAIAAGRSVEEYTKEFEQLLPKLVGYGRDASDIYKNLNAIAQAGGGALKASDIMQFAASFDDWDKSAKAVSDFNSALGGMYMNITDIYAKDPAEIAMKFKEAFNRTGKDFKELNRGFQQMMAEPLGGDLTKAAEFYNGTLADAYANMAKTKAEAEDLEKRTKNSAAAQDKLNKAIDSMKISLAPIVETVAGIAETIAGWIEKAGGFKSVLVSMGTIGVVALGAAFRTLGVVIKTSIGGALSEVQTQLALIRQELQMARGFNGPYQDVGGGGGGGTGKGARALGIATTALGLAAVGATMYEASNTQPQQTPEEQSKNMPVLSANPGGNSPVITGNAIDITGRQPIFGLGQNGFYPIANAAGNDQFTVTARRPEDLAAAQQITVAPVVAAISEIAETTKVLTDRESSKERFSMINSGMHYASSEKMTATKESEARFASTFAEQASSKLALSPNFSFPNLKAIINPKESGLEEYVNNHNRNVIAAAIEQSVDANQAAVNRKDNFYGGSNVNSHKSTI
jgi:hypothetical protein